MEMKVELDHGRPIDIDIKKYADQYEQINALTEEKNRLTEKDQITFTLLKEQPLKLDEEDPVRLKVTTQYANPESVTSAIKLLTLGAAGDKKVQLLLSILALKAPYMFGEPNHDILRGYSDICPEPIQIFNRIVYHSIQGAEFEPAEKKRFLARREFSPEKIDAMFRDVGRLLDQLNKPNRPDFIPRDIGGDFENPFGFSADYFDPDRIIKLINKPIRAIDRKPTDQAIEQHSNYASDIETNFRSQLKDLESIAETSARSRKAMHAWNNHSGDYPLLSVGSRFFEFDYLSAVIEDLNDRKKFFERYYSDFLSDDECLENFFKHAALINTAENLKIFITIIHANRNILNNLVQIARCENMASAGLALFLLNESVRNDQDLLHIVRNLITTPAELESPTLAVKLMIFASNYDKTPRTNEMIIRTLLKNKQIWDQIYQIGLPDFENEQELDPWIDQIIEHIKIFQHIEKADLKKQLLHLIDKKSAPVDFHKVFAEITTPPNFDRDAALAKIRSAKSWAPPEPRILSGIPEIPRETRWLIKPHPGNDSVDAWRIVCESRGYQKGNFSSGESIFDYINGHLSQTNVPKLTGQLREKMENFGIFLAWQFFIRHEVEILQAEKLREIETQTKSVEAEKKPSAQNESSIVRETTSPRKSGVREEKAPEVDLRDKDKTEIESKKNAVQKYIIATKSLVLKALSGEITDSEIENLFLFKEEAFAPGRSVFERVPPTEVKQHIQNDTLSGENFFVLDRAPHIRQSGYHPSVSKNGLFKISQMGHSEASEMARLLYEDSGLPKLSDLSEISTTLSILVDDPEYTPEKFGPISKIAFGIHNSTWRNSWMKSLQRVLEQEISEIEQAELHDKPAYQSRLTELSQNASENQTKIENLKLKIAEIEQAKNQITKKQAEINSLPELEEKILKKTYVIIDKENSTAHACLTMGWVINKTTFNQGKFVPIQSLLEESDDRLSGDVKNE